VSVIDELLAFQPSERPAINTTGD